MPQVLADGSYFFPAESGPHATRTSRASACASTDGNSWYKALIVGASSRFSARPALQASYTFGKSDDHGSQAVGSGDFANSFQPRVRVRSDRQQRAVGLRHPPQLRVQLHLTSCRSRKPATGFVRRSRSGWQFVGHRDACAPACRSRRSSGSTARARARGRAAAASGRTRRRASAEQRASAGRSSTSIRWRSCCRRPAPSATCRATRSSDPATRHGTCRCSRTSGSAAAPGAVPLRGVQPPEPRELRAAGADRVQLGRDAIENAGEITNTVTAGAAVSARVEVRVLVTASNRQERR